VANREEGQTQAEADKLKNQGMEIFTVGVTSQIDVDQLKKIASTPSDSHYYYVDNFNQLQTVLSKLISATCSGAQNQAPPFIDFL